MVVTLSLGAAFAYALASVLQQRSAASAPESAALRPSLMLHLVRQPLWLAGLAADFGGYGLQALALSRGSLLVVQPLLATGILFALPLGAALSRRRMTAGEGLAALGVAGGLAVLLTVGSPAGGRSQAPVASWLATALAVTAVTVALLLVARDAPAHVRAALIAVATGVVFGLSAALTKSTFSLVHGDGVLHVLTVWQPYALALVSGVGQLLAQSAFQAGALPASLPAITVVDPVTSSVIGVVLLHERLRVGGIEALVVSVAAVVTAVGVILLARSPLVTARSIEPVLEVPRPPQ